MIEYSVSIPDAKNHLIDVRLDVISPDPDGQLLRLPNWIPGSYMIRDFSRNIVSVTATGDGRNIALHKLDKSTWCAPAGLARLSVHYRVYAWDLSVRAAHVDQTHAFFNGTSVYLAVAGQEKKPHRVILNRPDHDTAAKFEVATSLRAVEIDEAGYGLYQATDYDDLIDHPVEQGSFKRLNFDACGVPHELILTGACHFDEARVTRDLARICEYQIRFFGEPAPVDRYLFLTMVVDSGYGGLEHRSSTALMITRENLPVSGDDATSDAYVEFLGLCSHEYFHTWNVKRIKPARFSPYELHAESHTELLWFFEGMTSYYDDLVLVRAGLIDDQRYLGLLAKTLTRVQRGPGRLSQTVTESSFDAWHKFYKQDENAPNAIVSYYAKGALVALCLDALMREKSKGQKSLDTLMHSLWSQWLEHGKGVEEDEPQQLASRIAGTDLSGFFESALYSTEELPIVDALRGLGISLVWRARHSSSDMGSALGYAVEGLRSGNDSISGSQQEAGDDASDTVNSSSISHRKVKGKTWLGANVSDAPGGVKILQVLSGGPAEQAGLAAGDVLVAMNRLSVNRVDVDNHLSRHADLESIAIHYFRLGQLYESQLPVEPSPNDTAELAVCVRERVEGWLHGVRSSQRIEHAVADS